MYRTAFFNILLFNIMEKPLVEQVADTLGSFSPIKDALWTFLVNKVYFVAFLELPFYYEICTLQSLSRHTVVTAVAALF